MYQTKNCFITKQHILTTSLLDILFDCAFVSTKQHHPICLKYSLWMGCLDNRAIRKKEILSFREFSYVGIWFPSEASPICKKKWSPDSESASEITYRFFDSPEIANATAIFLADCWGGRQKNWQKTSLCCKETLSVIDFIFREWENLDTSLVLILPASSIWQLIKLKGHCNEYFDGFNFLCSILDFSQHLYFPCYTTNNTSIKQYLEEPH